MAVQNHWNNFRKKWVSSSSPAKFYVAFYVKRFFLAENTGTISQEEKKKAQELINNTSILEGGRGRYSNQI